MLYPAPLYLVAFFALLAALFSSLYAQDRRAAFLLWALSWAVLAFRHIAAATIIDATAGWFAFDAALLGLSGLLILLGGLAFAGRARLDRIAVAVFGLAVGVLAAFTLIAMVSLAPAAGRLIAIGLAVLAAGWIGAGWLLYRYGREEAPIGALLAGLSLIAWGVWIPVADVLTARIAPGLWLATVDAAFGAFVVVGMVIFALDRYSPRRLLDTEIRRMNDELQRAARIQSEFLSNTTHELKTPLTSIMANTEILEYEMCGPINDEQRRVLSNISRNSQHLLEMISRLLDFSRQREGVATLRVEDVDPRQILEGVAETVRPLLDEKRLRLAIEIDPEIGICRLDGEKIYRVYLNLVENAIKFSSQGTILTRAARVDGEFEGMVGDEGIGIPADRIDDIFQAFTQVDASSTRSYPGVGLGLAISRQLIELHGGRIWAESELGKGSTFRFRVPCGTPSAVAAASIEVADAG
jgi:signal transduction histidine kinase